MPAKRSTYCCICHGFRQIGNFWVMEMTIDETHENGYRAGTRGHSSRVKSVDFERGIVETLNSTYHIHG